MTTTTSPLLKKHFLPLLTFIAILIALFGPLETRAKANDGVPASLVGVHHLGPDYIIHRFYINKAIGDNIGEGGGGGSMVCCISLPAKWNSSLTVDVRWEVAHIIRSPSSSKPDTGEIEGIYQARVPVEQYTEPGDFYVHFFPNGQVRIVVSTTSSDSEVHPIKSRDMGALRFATKGKTIQALFSQKEISELQKAADNERKKYGDWR